METFDVSFNGIVVDRYEMSSGGKYNAQDTIFRVHIFVSKCLIKF